MPSDFYNSFERHKKDAELLWNSNRWANADHLYGLAAECALKALLLTQGIQISHRKYKKHINDLWDQYNRFMQTRSIYLIPTSNPFSNWNIAQRYENEINISRSNTQNHRNTVIHIAKIIKQAKRDGIL